jgi:hypothetical protein
MSKEGNKIDDPFFINKIDKYDLAFLTETHIGYDTNIPIIGNFICYIVCRPKTKANNRYFGGIAILIKKELKPHIKILKNTRFSMASIDFFPWNPRFYQYLAFLKFVYQQSMNWT